MSAPSNPSSFSTTLRMPRSMFVPWSPSPIAVSSRTSSALCSATAAANRRSQSVTAACPSVASAALMPPIAGPACRRARPTAR